jgi:hypothetical protein
VEFLATSFALEAGSFVCPSIHEVLGPPLSYATPLNHPGRGASHSGLFVWSCCVVLYENSCILRIYEGSIGRTGDIAPSTSDVIPTGSKRFALQGIEYRVRVCCAQSVIGYGVDEAVCSGKASSRIRGLRGQRPKTQDPGGGTAGFALRLRPEVHTRKGLLWALGPFEPPLPGNAPKPKNVTPPPKKHTHTRGGWVGFRFRWPLCMYADVGRASFFLNPGAAPCSHPRRLLLPQAPPHPYFLPITHRQVPVAFPAGERE